MICESDLVTAAVVSQCCTRTHNVPWASIFIEPIETLRVMKDNVMNIILRQLAARNENITCALASKLANLLLFSCRCQELSRVRSYAGATCSEMKTLACSKQH